MTIVGIIGFGSFGRFAAGVLSGKDVPVKVHDPKGGEPLPGVARASLAEVAQCDVVVLAVPLQAYDELLPRLKPLLPPETLVVDICSVKAEPLKRIHRHLADHPNLLGAHPMFGPQSAAKGLAGHVFVVCEVLGEKAQQAVNFCRAELGLQIMDMTAAEHDQAMAEVHALTFFVARGLNRIGLQPPRFQAPSFALLLELVAFDQTHSEELFRTIEAGNPYAAAARQRLLDTLAAIHQEVSTQQGSMT
jgi:prephenate dehydrogenase